MFSPIETTLVDFWPFLTSYGLLLVMPGPNAILVVQASLYGSARSAALTAGGIASGAAILAALAAAGAFAVADGHAVRRIANAVFISVLIVYGAKAIWRAARADGAALRSDTQPAARHFTLGFLTAVANPVTAAFFLSFAAGAGARDVASQPAVFSACVFVLVVTWFMGLGLLLRVPAVRRHVTRNWRAVDGLAGLILVVSGGISASHLYLS